MNVCLRYDLSFGMQYIHKIKFLRYVPFSLTYQQYDVNSHQDEERALQDEHTNNLIDSKL